MLIVRRLIACAIAGLARLATASSALAAVGSISGVPVGARAHSYLFGLTTGPDGRVWFADLSCTGLGRRPAIGRITPRGQITEFRRGLPRGSVPFGITRRPATGCGSPTTGAM